jgi:hypothetical protein
MVASEADMLLLLALLMSGLHRIRPLRDAAGVVGGSSQPRSSVDERVMVVLIVAVVT